MRHAASVLAAALALGAPVAARAADPAPATAAESALDAEEHALAQAIVAQIMPPEQRGAMMRQMLETLLAQLRGAMGKPGTPPGVTALLDRKLATIPDRLMPVIDLHMPRILDGMAEAYVREFSVEELREIRNFAVSPSGAHYLSRSTAMIGDPSVAAANQAYLRDVQALQTQFVAEVGNDIRAYLAKHPDGK